MADKIRESKVRCSFCHKTEDQVQKLIAGPDGAYICDQCIAICSEIMEEELGGYERERGGYDGEINLLKPEEIHAILMTMSSGRTKQKRSLSVAVYNHYKRMLPQTGIWMWSCRKATFLCWPTGSGKTLLAQTLARLLNVPFAIADATSDRGGICRRGCGEHPVKADPGGRL